MDLMHRKVLALNDGIHDTYFVTEEGIRYTDATALVKMLCGSHLAEYHIRGVWSELPEKKLAEYEDAEISLMFDKLMARVSCRTATEFSELFDLFWSSSSQYWNA